MPEGHTLHRYAGALRADLVGGVVRTSSPQGKFTAEAAATDGQVLESAEAHGKNLLLALGDAGTVHVHLGLRGLFLRYDDPSAEPRKGTRLRIAGERAAYDLIAPSTCALLDDAGVSRLLGTLGPDPLRPGADMDEAVRRLRAHPKSVGAALMDQSALAGVGNVYRAEVLYRHRLDPRTPAKDLPREAYERMWLDLQALMDRGVRVGNILTVDDAPDDVVPEQGRYVYKQAVCRGCGGAVRTWTLDGRDCYACEREQLRE